MKKFAVIGGLIALVLLGGALLYRQYWYYLPGIVGEIRNPISAHREIGWEPGPAEAPAGARPPNIIVIVADDLGYNDISLFGGGVAGVVKTPNIDAIGSDGVVVEQGYTTNGTCSPSRAGIMTGRYPTRFGFEFTSAPQALARYVSHSTPGALHQPIFHEDRVAAVPPRETLGLPPGETTIAELLKQKGYQTLLVGKWHLGETKEMRPQGQGFDEALAVLQGAAMFLPKNHPDVVNAPLDFDPIDRFLWANLPYAVEWQGREGEARFRPTGYVTDYFADEAAKAITANRNRPFFLYLAFTAPHTPLQATREDYDALAAIPDHTQRVYGAMIRSLDRGVGRVMQALRDNGIDENTIVMFVSDNGGAWYTGLADINAPFRGWKSTFFEGGIRTPYFIRWPGGLPRGVRVPGPATHLDIFTTAAAAAGAAAPTNTDGIDLLPYLRGAPQPSRTIFWRSGPYRVVRDGDWKLQVAETPNRTWLFNLREDPFEKNDLSASDAPRVAAMRAMLEAQNAGAPAPLWPALIEAPVRVDVPLNAPWNDKQEYVYWSN